VLEVRLKAALQLRSMKEVQHEQCGELLINAQPSTWRVITRKHNVENTRILLAGFELMR
jgi:hypothetical protein